MSENMQLKNEGRRYRLNEDEEKWLLHLRQTGTIPHDLTIHSDKNTAKLEAKYRHVKRLYNAALQELDVAQESLNVLESLESTTVNKPSIKIAQTKLKQNKKKSRSVAFAVASDWHFEEEVDPNTINGLNEYTIDIAKKRIRRFFEKSLYLVEIMRGETQVDQMVVALLGDLLSGTIHEDLLEINQLSTVETIVELTNLIREGIDFLVEKGNFKQIHVPCCYGNHGRCHDETTELLTRDGWKKHNELEIGDLVATYNMNTGVNEWQPLTDVYVADYSGPMIHVNTTTADYMVTPHHRMVVRSHNGSDKFVEMQEIIKEGTFGSLNWPKCSMGHDVDYPDVTDDELRLLGWIITDGSYGRQRNNISVRIHQSKHDSFDKIIELLDKMKIKYGVHTRTRNHEEIIICGKELKSSLPEKTITIKKESSGRILKLLPDKKTIPDWMKDLSKRQFNVFIESLLDGDGTVREKESVIYGSCSVLSQIQELAVTNGIPARLRTDNRNCFILSLPKTVRGYINNFNDSVKETYYQGIIWCGTVKNGTLITRRNGIPLVSGNTTQKKRIATGHRNSFETLMYQFLAMVYDKHPIVTFQVPLGYHVFVNPFGKYPIRLHHGDAIRYAGGVGGISIPVNKAVASWNRSKSVYMDVFGHFHQTKDGGNWLSNGSLIGYNAYALSIKADYEPPTQTFFMIEESKGKTFIAPIILEDPVPQAV